MERNLVEEFHDIFNAEENLKTLHGKPMKIYAKEEAVPHAIHVARPVPKAWEKVVMKSLEKMIQQGIIASLDDETSEWCHPMIIAPKQNGGAHICVDLTNLNKYVERPIHPTHSSRDAVNNISSDANFFTFVDATQGYWLVPFYESSQSLTTFLTLKKI